jgi:EmrB/QacA subfamily drug resistance transporter
VIVDSRARNVILGVLCAATFAVNAADTIVTVALPELVHDLGATTRDLQWVLDGYLVAFAALLLPGGSLGDRFGRDRVLLVGLAVFGLGSAAAGWSGSPSRLVVWHTVMGAGAALVYPATLAILVDTFRSPRQRARAIGVWAGTGSLALALGPLVGGWLLSRSWWGSVFVVNVPVVVVAAVAVAVLAPSSKHPQAGPVDVVGMALSSAAFVALAWAAIEAPSHGWTGTQTLVALVACAASGAGFVAWEQRCSHPLLDLRVFRDARFSAGALAVTLSSFALMGFIFLATQYLQLVRGYEPFEAGLRTIPFALVTGVSAPVAMRLLSSVGSRAMVAGGLVLMAAGFASVAAYETDTPYALLLGSMLLLGTGMGMVGGPATEAIMGAMPPDAAGVGSAVNDATRQVGACLGVAVVGSLFASVYSEGVGARLADAGLSGAGVEVAARGIGDAQTLAASLPAPMADAVHHAANAAFLDGFAAGGVVAALLALAGAAVAWFFLPARRAGAAHVTAVVPCRRAPAPVT